MSDGTLIHSRRLLARIVCFDGMERIRGIYPTDIDAYLDYGGRAALFIECKHKDNKLPAGQRRALERLTNKCKTNAVIVCEHEFSEGDIMLKDCIVTEVFFNGKWTTQNKGVTVIKAVERFENNLIAKGIKL